MEGTIKQSGKDKRVKKNKQERKYMDMIIDGKLKDPPPSIMEKISVELDMDIHPR